jgi:hypothetical protein
MALPRPPLAIAAAAVVGLVAGALRFWTPHLGNDMSWPLCYARQLLQGNDPYAAACDLPGLAGPSSPANPLTTALVAIPFAGLDPYTGAALLVAGSYGLLAWALVRRRGPAYLIVLLSFPSLVAFVQAQWSPLLLAVALLPGLLPLTTIKPHIGLPIAIIHLTRRRALACVAFVGLTFMLDPTWPIRWLPLTGHYAGHIPLLTFPGLVTVLLGLSWWRDRDMRLLLLCALVPQIPEYDALVLAAAMRTSGEVKVWTACSWAAGLGQLVHHVWFADSFLARVFDPGVMGLYLPACGLVLARRLAGGAREHLDED